MMSENPAKLIGRIGWVMQPGYPELSGEEGDETITERYVVGASEIGAIPLPGTAYANAEHSFFNAFSGLRLQSRTVRAMAGGKTYEVVLVYAYPPGMAPLGDTEVYESVEYSTREFSAPLNQHPDYRYNWDHKLLAAEGVVSSPSWWSTAVDDRMKEEESRQWRWARPDESVPDQWRVLLPEEKPGITSYLTGVAVVTHTCRSASRTKLIRKIADDFHIATPPETFGATGFWLRGGSSMRKEGRYWVQRVTYTNTSKLDGDIYVEA